MIFKNELKLEGANDGADPVTSKGSDGAGAMTSEGSDGTGRAMGVDAGSYFVYKASYGTVRL